MNQTIKTTLIAFLLLLLPLTSQAARPEKHAHEHEAQKHADDKHRNNTTGKDTNQHRQKSSDNEETHEDHDAHHEGVSLSSSQLALAGIKVVLMEPRTMNYQVYAPGEIKANGYSS